MKCFICKGELERARTSSYERCCGCGHETLRSGQVQQLMVNDVLDIAVIRRRDPLIRWQAKVAALSARRAGRLIDVGCGSGRFLLHARARFPDGVGVEVSPDSLQFAREELRLEVFEQLPALTDPPALVTFWHSLEHIPSRAIDELLAALARAVDSETRLVVSVPNAGSWQHRLLGRRYAYFDAPYHLHQFSSTSLDHLLSRHGFVRERDFAGLPYQLFGWLQGLANCLMPIRNYAYYRAKRGRFGELPGVQRWCLDALATVATLLVGPIAIAACLIDLTSASTRGVVTRCYRKNP